MEKSSISNAFESSTRITIVAALFGGEMGWSRLKDLTGASDGNLSTHLSKLESIGFIIVNKEFLGKKPHSIYRLTDKAIREFTEYVNMLEKLINNNPG